MSGFTEVAGTLFGGFCSAIGCGGSIGLLFLGLFILFFIFFAIYKIDLGLDGAVIVGTMTLIALAQGGFLPQWFEPITWIGVFGLIGLAIYKISR